MDYSFMTTRKLETLKFLFERQTNEYVGMSFVSPGSEFVSYEIDSVDSDEILITVNHPFNGLIRDYIVNIKCGVHDDVEYSRYVDNGDLIDGGYMSFDCLPEIIRNVVLEIYGLYKKLEKINNILDTRIDVETKGVHKMKRIDTRVSPNYQKLTASKKLC